MKSFKVARSVGRPLVMRLSRGVLQCALLSWTAGFAVVAALVPAVALAEGKTASMVIDANTGNVLSEHEGDALRHPASLTKMMTLYMAFEGIEQGRLDFETKLIISDHAAAMSPSKLELAPGDEITLLDACKALITKSANDVSVAIAEKIGGSEAEFARMMTERAKLLGMTQTVFKNASGLPDMEQVTTARDMLTLAMRLQDDFPKHYRLFATRTFTYGGETHRNHNRLLVTFAGVDGIKTGYTRASGFNLVSSVRRGSKHIVGVVFGGRTAGERNAEMRRLLTRGLAKASSEKTRKPVLVANSSPVEPGARPMVVAKSQAKRESAPQEAPPKVVESKGDTAKKPATVAVAKVRPVRLTPRVAPPSSLENSTEEPDVRTETSPQTTKDAKDSNKTVPAPPPALATASLVSGPPVPRPKPAPQKPRAASPATDPQPSVREPSTLDAQAAALKEDTPPEEAVRSEPMERPQPAHAPLASLPKTQAESGSPPGSFHIQIGAFGDEEFAKSELGSVRERTGGLLAAHPPMTQPVERDGNQLFRARFTDFDRNSAKMACAELKRLEITCVVVKGE